MMVLKKILGLKFLVFSSLAPHIMTLGFSSCWCVKRLHLIFFFLAPLQPGQYICLLHEQSRCGNWLVSGLTLPQLSEVYTTNEWSKDRYNFGWSLKSFLIICLLHYQSRYGNWWVSGLTLPQLREVYTTNQRLDIILAGL